MKHPVVLNHHIGVLLQVLRVDRPEVTLAGPEHGRCDIHAHLVDQTRGKHLARVPLTVICTAFPASAYQDYANRGVPFLAALLDYDDVTYLDLPTGHWPLWSKPAAHALLIAQASAWAGGPSHPDGAPC